MKIFICNENSDYLNDTVELIESTGFGEIITFTNFKKMIGRTDSPDLVILEKQSCDLYLVCRILEEIQEKIAPRHILHLGDFSQETVVQALGKENDRVYAFQKPVQHEELLGKIRLIEKDCKNQ